MNLRSATLRLLFTRQLQSSYKVECNRYSFKTCTQTKPYCTIAYCHSKGLLRADRLIGGRATESSQYTDSTLDATANVVVAFSESFNGRRTMCCGSLYIYGVYYWIVDTPHEWPAKRATLWNQKSNTFLHHLNDIRPTMHWEPHAIKVARVVWRLWLLACHRSSR